MQTSRLFKHVKTLFITARAPRSPVLNMPKSSLKTHSFYKASVTHHFLQTQKSSPARAPHSPTHSIPHKKPQLPSISNSANKEQIQKPTWSTNKWRIPPNTTRSFPSQQINLQVTSPFDRNISWTGYWTTVLERGNKKKKTLFVVAYLWCFRKMF